MLASPIIEIKNLSAGYDNRTVLHDVNLTIYERDFLGIIGPNGGGKTNRNLCNYSRLCGIWGVENRT